MIDLNIFDAYRNPNEKKPSEDKSKSETKGEIKEDKAGTLLSLGFKRSVRGDQAGKLKPDLNGNLAKKRRHRHRKPKESASSLEILCSECRRLGTFDRTRQTSLAIFFTKKEYDTGDIKGPTNVCEREELSCPEVSKLEQSPINDDPTSAPVSHGEDANYRTIDVLICAKCRRPLEEKKKSGLRGSKSSVCPFILRLRNYQRVAEDKGTPFLLSDSEALDIMKQDCSMCGKKRKDNEIHGITRLRRVIHGKDMMGPYSKENTAPSCATCNLMKTYHSRKTFIKICKHITTQQRRGNYGKYPECFRNNISKKNRSSYITASKTHSLTNRQFEDIVSKPCYFCGKEHRPPVHYNGLDRLDSTKRVYTTTSCVACCGTCNIAKGRLTEECFLNQAERVAKFNAIKETMGSRVTARTT